MESTKTTILNKVQIAQRINRLAYQVFEDNLEEKEILVAGIAKTGYIFAKKIVDVLKKISPLNVELIELTIDKHSQERKEISLPFEKENLKGRVIVLIDDVLNSGKTMIYAIRPFLQADIKKIRTVVLVDRNHKRFPVAADFVGISLATTSQEHITVAFEKEGEEVYLS